MEIRLVGVLDWQLRPSTSASLLDDLVALLSFRRVEVGKELLYWAHKLTEAALMCKCFYVVFE
jgi:hypothetical protein